MQSSDPAVLSVVASPVLVKLNMKGIHCTSCMQAVEAQLLQQPDVLSARLDVATATATVECQTDVNPVELIDRLTAAGFSCQLQPPQAESTGNFKAKVPIHWASLGFFMLLVSFNLCLNAQVLTVGLAYFYHPAWWQVHVWLVRGYSGLSLILLAWAYQITLPQRVRSLTISLPLLLELQFLTIHLKTPIPLAVVHPLIGFTMFSISTTLVHRVNRFLFPQADGYSPTR